MNYSVLIPLLVPLTVAIILPLLSSIGRRGKEDVVRNVYRYSVGIQIFLWVGAFLVALLPFAFEAFGVTPKVWQWWAIFAMVVFVVFCGAYTHRYVLELRESHLSFGAFWRRNIDYKDIRSSEIRTSGRGSVFLIVKYADKGRVAISGDLQDFDDLVKRLHQRVGS